VATDDERPGDRRADEMDALRKRMQTLRNEINAKAPLVAQGSGSGPKPDDAVLGSEMSRGLRAGSEFVAAIVLGAAIGWGLDWLLHTKPLLTILFFLLGGVAGVFNVIRATSPKGAQIVRDSRLSGEGAEAKDVPRVRPRGGEREED
jgi:ATP synthase protein I